MKTLWVLVGGNGAGKTTFYEATLRPLGLPFVNADIIAKEFFPTAPEEHSYEAAKLAETVRNDQLMRGASFCFETVFSHPSKIDFLARAKVLGYRIVLVVTHVEDPAVNLARIRQRVLEGGHDVPADKVVARIPRTLENIGTAIPLCDDVRVLDNSRIDAPYLPVLTIKDGVRTNHMDPLPAWADGF